MVDEWFTDAERRLVLRLVTNAGVQQEGNPSLHAELIGILSKLSGVDTALFARRAYPSRGKEGPMTQGGEKILCELREVMVAQAEGRYRDDACPERTCDHCQGLYRGPAVYCSLQCAEADA